MNDDSEFMELKRMIHLAITEGKATIQLTRTCSKPDIEGVREILSKHDIGALYVKPVGIGLNQETFYKIHDEKLNMRGREILLREWSLFPKPKFRVGDYVFRQAYGLGSYHRTRITEVKPCEDKKRWCYLVNDLYEKHQNCLPEEDLFETLMELQLKWISKIINSPNEHKL